MEKDAWDMGGKYSELLFGSEAWRLAEQLRFTFVDLNGQVSNREVLSSEFASDGTDGAIRGHCKMRDANRVFVMSRMSHVVDVQTGASISDLPRWMLDKHAASPQGKMLQFVAAHEAALGLLAGMARADGSMRGPERAQIALWCLQHGAVASTAALVAKDLRRWENPSAIAIGKWLRSIQDTPSSYRGSVLKTMEIMIGTDKQVRDNETRLLARATKELRDRS